MLAHFEIKRGPRSSNVSCVRSMQQHLLTHKLQYFWKAGASWFRGTRGGPSGCCPQHREARSRAPSCPAAGRRGSRQQQQNGAAEALRARQTNKPGDTANRAGVQG